MARRAPPPLLLMLAVLLPLSACEAEGGGDDDTAVADDDAAGDDDEATPVAPVISDLQIELDQSGSRDELVFSFHFEDPDADIPGGYATIFIDGEVAAGADIPASEPRYTSGDLALALDVPEGNLTYGATFLFGVSLTDAGGRESNVLEAEYTIPEDEP